jgi:copper(I)-binding protein
MQRLQMRAITSLFISLFLILPTAQAQETKAEPDLVPKGAWVRSTLEKQPMSAAYLSLRNTTQETIEIIGVETDASKQSLIHKTIDEDGVAKMRHQKSVTVEPGKKVIFEQGGLHVMLLGLDKPIKEGEFVTLNFKTKKGKTIEVKALARSAPCPYGCCDP